jgi:hypothetical protein
MVSPSKPTSLAHTRLVLPPLLITTAFCFILALTQQPIANNQASATATEKTGSKTRSGLSSKPLEPAQTLDPITVTSSAAPQASQALTNTNQSQAKAIAGASKATAQPQPNAAPGSAVQSSTRAIIPQDSILKVTQPLTNTLRQLIP